MILDIISWTSTKYVGNNTYKVSDSKIVGNNLDVYGDRNEIIGNNNDVYGNGNKVKGNNCDVYGENSHIYGNNGDYHALKGSKLRKVQKVRGKQTQEDKIYNAMEQHNAKRNKRSDHDEFMDEVSGLHNNPETNFFQQPPKSRWKPGTGAFAIKGWTAEEQAELEKFMNENGHDEDY
jgi:hypothetical protein